MPVARVVAYVDIEAPREDVFDIVANCDLRLQLSPLWGVASVKDVTPDFPQEGSRYRLVFVRRDVPEFDTIVTAFQPDRKFAYRLTVDRQTRVTWTVQDVARGTRLIYNEEYLTEEDEGEEFDQAVRQVVKSWLNNIRRYAELRDGHGRKFVKWLLDRYFLKLRADQRRVIVAILILQAIGGITFVLVVIVLGIASLI